MVRTISPSKNYEKTRKIVGYTPRKETPPETYEKLGFMSGLEIHQQLLTDEKLFCRCPAGKYQHFDDFDAEIVRHMRPTLSELGEYDGTALMEFKTRKNITYRLKNETACTYEIDDTPPFPLNRKALDIAIEIAYLLNLNIVGELHITRKQYLDGSIPTGFQRTAIVGISGHIPLKDKKIGIIQLSIEEDSCREVFDIGHERIYTTDRLGMPLIEMVTYPDMKNPDEAMEVGQYLRFLARSTGKVRVGIGAGRQDVNVSVKGGTRVEIKGVAHISWIPELTHNEAFRQHALLQIKDELNKRVENKDEWKISHKIIDLDVLPKDLKDIKNENEENKLIAVNLPKFKGVLSYFTRPGKCFANEIIDRLKVIACLEKPNMVTSEDIDYKITKKNWDEISTKLGSSEEDVQIVFWATDYDIKTALETIEERCLLAFEGVPNETRKSFPDGTTIFERVLPGPDRMYPDTDSAPISISEEHLQKIRKGLPEDLEKTLTKLQQWNIPIDAYTYILRNNLSALVNKIAVECDVEHKFVAVCLAHRLKHYEGTINSSDGFKYERIYDLFKYLKKYDLKYDLVKEMIPIAYEQPNMLFDSILTLIEYDKNSKKDILSQIDSLRDIFKGIQISKDEDAEFNWIMGKIRKMAIGDVVLTDLAKEVRELLK